MSEMDPYALCMCGSGKKVRWCCGKAFEQIEKVYELLESRQEEKALELARKLPEHGAAPAFAKALEVQLLLGSRQLAPAIRALEAGLRDFPEYGYLHETNGMLLMATGQFDAAREALDEALRYYPAAAIEHRARVHASLGSLQDALHRPLAAWAHLQRALKLKPDYDRAILSLKEMIQDNETLPNPVRHGLRLRSPDELAVFNEARRQRWDQALERQAEGSLEELADAFQFLADDDSFDVAARYNLALCRAWQGENALALDALDKYLEQEKNFEAAAAAADLGEVLRLGVGVEDRSDFVVFVASYRTENPEALLEQLQTCKQIIVFTGPEHHLSIHVIDRESPDAAAAGLIAVQPKQLAQITLLPAVLEISATRESYLTDARAIIERHAGNYLRWEATARRAAGVASLDAEPFLVLAKPGQGKEARARENLERVRAYFEEDWLHRPLKSLHDLAPLDAVQSPKYRPCLEGILRFRERNFAQFGLTYSFDRLRNKLGLQSLAPQSLLGEANPDISSYSVAELTKLEPDELGDEDLQTAYRTACSLDAPRTAARFAESLIRRPVLADRVDLAGAYRKIIQERFEEGQRAGLPELIKQAIEFDRDHYAGEHIGDFEMLQARLQLVEGDALQAVETMRALFEREKENLDLLAGGVERLLSAGAYQPALEFAKLGMERAKTQRNRDRHEQFQEYAAAAGARAKT